MEKWEWNLYFSGQLDAAGKAAMKRKIRAETRDHYLVEWVFSPSSRMVILDAPIDNLLNACWETLTGGIWIHSEHPRDFCCLKNATREEWEAEVAGSTYPEDIFKRGGLLEMRSPRGELLNTCTLLPAAYHGERSHHTDRPGGRESESQ